MGARAPRAYRVLLRVLPRGFRERHGAEMEALLCDAMRRAPGPVGRARVWASVVWDVLRRAPLEHRRGWPPLVSSRRKQLMILADVRFALRTLRRQPAVSLLVVGMLALGIAASTAVFSLINGLYLRPLPFPDADRLVYLNEQAPRWNLEFTGINYPDFVRWREGAQQFEWMALVDNGEVNYADGGGATRLNAAWITQDFFGVLGVGALLGRTFELEEHVPNGPRVAVLSRDLWRSRFGADPSIVGSTLRLNSAPYTVVGVVPAHAEFPSEADVFLPIQDDPQQPWQSYNYDGIGRLKPGVTLEAALQDLMRAHAPIFEERDAERVVTPRIMPLRDRYVGDLRTVSIALASAVAIVLLIACANVASLMLARALARHREMGVRLALGAGTGRLLRQLFVENLVFATVGGALGLAGGYWLSRLLVAGVPDQLPDWVRFDLDVRIVVFSALLVVTTAVLFGLAPAFYAFGHDLRGALSEGGARTTAAASGRRTLSLLIAAEVALSAMLLVGGGLFLRAYHRLRDVDPGFRTDHVLTFGIALPSSVYDSSEKLLRFWEDLSPRLGAVPGVQAAGVISCPPLTCHWGNFYVAEGVAPRGADEPNPVVLTRVASPGYFDAMGIRLQRGRFFEEADGRTEGSRAVIVNETFAKLVWPEDADPVGRRIRGRGEDPQPPWMTVVGVVADVKHYGLDVPMRPGIYMPLPQNPLRQATLALYTRGAALELTGAVRRVVADMDAELPIYQVSTMQDRLRSSLALRETYSWLLTAFACLAVLLALGGIYGVASYAVTQRTREIGIRIALGARTGQVLGAVLRGGMVIVTCGVLLGLLGALAGARALSSLLFGVDAGDPMVYGGVALLLVATALVANFLPARRASRIEPMTSLRD